MGKTAVIILEYNNSEDTINCIDSVMRHNTSPIKFVVVDNGSTKREVVSELEDYFGKRFPGEWQKLNDGDEAVYPLPLLTFLESGTNDGYARGNNKGLALTDPDTETDSILILNSDILFTEDIIPPLLKALATKDTAIVSPALYTRDMAAVDWHCLRRPLTNNEAVWMKFPFPYDPFRINERRGQKFTPGSGLIPMEIPSGSCMLLSKDTFKELGWFDPGTFLYFEEDILYEKTKARGLRNYIDTDTRCIHLGGTTTGASPSRFVVGCGYSSVRYYLKNYRHATKAQFALLEMFRRLMMLKIKIKETLGR